MPAIQASDLAQGHALYVSACLATSQSDHAEARATLEICLRLRRRLGNPVDIAATLSTLSLARLQAGDAKGAAAAEHEALKLFCDVGDRLGEAIGLLHLGEIAISLGDDSTAKLHLHQCLAVARELRNQEAEGECQLALGRSAYFAHDLTQSRLWLTRSFTVCREAGDKRGEANAVWWLGKCDLEENDSAAAHTRLEEAVKAFRAFGMREEVLGCLEDYALLMHAAGHTERTVQIAAAAAQSRHRLSLSRTALAEAAWQAQLAKWRFALSKDTFETEWQVGAEWSVDQAIAAASDVQRKAAMV